jgi:hypothetical protein
MDKYDKAMNFTGNKKEAMENISRGCKIAPALFPLTGFPAHFIVIYRNTGKQQGWIDGESPRVRKKSLASRALEW